MNDDYRTGWENSLQFRAEWHRLQQSSGSQGMPIMVLAGCWLSCMTAMLFLVGHIANYEPLFWGYGMGFLLAVVGFLLDRRESRVYKQRYEAFCTKWADKIPDWRK